MLGCTDLKFLIVHGGEVSCVTEDLPSDASDENVAWKMQTATSLRRTPVFHGKKSGMWAAIVYAR